MEAATPNLQPVWQPPRTEQTTAGHSVQAENWAQQTWCPHVQQVQGWWVWDVPMQCRHHDCRTSTAALSTTWCFEAGHVAWTNTTEGQVLWQPGGAEEGSWHHWLTADTTEGQLTPLRDSWHHWGTADSTEGQLTALKDSWQHWRTADSTEGQLTALRDNLYGNLEELRRTADSTEGQLTALRDNLYGSLEELRRTADSTEGQSLWQPGGAEEDSCFREGNRHLRREYEEEEEPHSWWSKLS